VVTGAAWLRLVGATRGAGAAWPGGAGAAWPGGAGAAWPGGAGAARLAAWAVFAFGLATIADGWLAPMDCAPYIDSGCALRERADLVSLAHQSHVYTSGVAVLAILIGLAALCRFEGPVRHAAAVVLVVELFADAGTVAAMLAGRYTGVAERLHVAGASAWLLVVALALGTGLGSGLAPPGRRDER
jgi:hypothetical protein